MLIYSTLSRSASWQCEGNTHLADQTQLVETQLCLFVVRNTVIMDRETRLHFFPVSCFAECNHGIASAYQ